MGKLNREFYQREDVVQIARELLGKRLMTRIRHDVTGGMITETEAYAGITDRASHAFGGRRTGRTEIMYRAGGTAYVYLCYGIHHLFNVVTNAAGVPDAVLVRAIQPDTGLETMISRRGADKTGKRDLAGGPGTVSQALGITTALTGTDLCGDQVWIEDRGIEVHPASIVSGPRIGVDYAGTDALLPYRFKINFTG